MRAGDDGLPVRNVGLVLRKPVRSGPGEALGGQGAFTIKHVDLVHHVFDRSTKSPAAVGWVVVVGRNEHVVSVFLPNTEQLLYVRNRAVGLDAGAD